jgi:hypothetical protein
MIENKFLYGLYLKRFNKLGKKFIRLMDEADKAEPLSEKKWKCLTKAKKVLDKREWLLDHMYPIHYRKES